LNSWKKWGLGLLLLAGVAGSAGGQMQVGEPNSFHGILQGQPVVGINRTDSTARLLTVSSGGVLSTAESAPAMDANLTFPNIIGPISTLAPGGADSSAILDTHRMRLGTLLIKCTPLSITGADSLFSIRLGVQIRTHLNGAGDSSSTFAFYQYGKSDVGAVTTTASQTDSTVAGQILNSLNLAAAVNSPYSGEFTVIVAFNRVGPGTSILGSLGQKTFTYPNGIAIPLSSLFGRDIYSPSTSVRIRNLGSAGNTRSCALTVHLVGTPL